MNSLDLRVVSTLEDFIALEQDWNELYKKSERSTIFSSWDWLITWWEVFQNTDKRDLLIICSYKENQLIGIAPLQIEKSYPLSFLQGKTLRFIGSSSKNEIMTELSDFIVSPDHERAFTDAVSDFLAENKKLWNFADFQFIQENALVLDCFNRSDAKIYKQKIEYGVRFLIPKLSSSDDYQNLISKRKRKDFSRINRVLERDGGSVTEVIEQTEQIEPMFNRLGDMHRERWEGKLDSCVFDMPEFREFHLKILERLFPKGKANISTLLLQDQALSSMYTFEDKGQVHYYQSGFYNEHKNKYSPLFVLICKLIGQTSEDGKRFDFMFDEDPESYKGHQYRGEANKMYRLKLTPQPYRIICFDYIKKVVNGIRETKVCLENRLSSNS